MSPERRALAGGCALLLAAGLVACAAGEPPASSSVAAAGHDAGASGAGQGGEAQGPPLGVRAMYHGGTDEEPLVPIEDGATLELRRPPQGGFVLWVAPEVDGAAGTQVEVRSLVRSKATGLILAEEFRTVSGGAGDSGGPWRVEPVNIRNVNNVPVCPNYGDELLIGVDVTLEVTVDDVEATPPRRGQAKLAIRLACPPASKNCPCECAVGYALGGCAAQDPPP